MMWARRTVLAAFLAPAVALAKKKKKGKEQPQQSAPLGLLTGTVFDSSGRALPGAKVRATAQDDEKVRLETRSDARGEYAFRAPAAAEPGAERIYRIEAEADGFKPGEKTASVYRAQKTTANLLLSPQ